MEKARDGAVEGWGEFAHLTLSSATPSPKSASSAEPDAGPLVADETPTFVAGLSAELLAAKRRIARLEAALEEKENSGARDNAKGGAKAGTPRTARRVSPLAVRTDTQPTESTSAEHGPRLPKPEDSAPTPTGVAPTRRNVRSVRPRRSGRGAALEPGLRF